jgi:putative tricarboxylic transport membrane protein
MRLWISASPRGQTRQVLLFLALFAGIFESGAVRAADWKPSRNVEIIVPFAAGGGNDLPARIIQKIIVDNKLINASSTVLNKPGGGGAVGLAYLNRHAGAGEYLSLISTSTLTSYIVGEGSINFTDVSPIVPLITEYIAIAVKHDSPIQSLGDFIAKMKKDPKSLSFGVGGALGNPNHVALAATLLASGIDPRQMKAVAFNSGSEAMTSALGGHVDVVAGPVDLYVPLVKAKRLRLLAVAAPRRLEGDMSSVLTLKEQNVDLVSAYTRYIVGPKGLSQDKTDYWSGVFSRLMKTAEWQKNVKANYWQSDFANSDATKNDLNKQFSEIKTVLGRIGMAKR